MTTSLLPCLERGPADAAAALVWLHGLGADATDFLPLVRTFAFPDDVAVRFVFPDAPARPVTINGGLVMPAWYDVREVDLQRQPDLDGVRASVAQVAALLEREEARGVPSARIVLGGFSQGGVVAYAAALGYPRALAGVVGLSCYLAAPDALSEASHPANATLPVYASHGRHDPLVPYARGLAAAEALRAAGHPVEWAAFPLAHEVSLPQLAHLRAWLLGRLAG